MAEVPEPDILGSLITSDSNAKKSGSFFFVILMLTIAVKPIGVVRENVGYLVQIPDETFSRNLLRPPPPFS